MATLPATGLQMFQDWTTSCQQTAQPCKQQQQQQAHDEGVAAASRAFSTGLKINMFGILSHKNTNKQ
jgi:invasion protein IalB